MDRKKELKELYKNSKSEMGVFIIQSKNNNKSYIQETHNLKNSINRAKFQLKFGSYPNKELQKEWEKYGESNFLVEVLEILQYDKDESKTDYSEELELLKMVWKEKLLQKGKIFYPN